MGTSFGPYEQIISLHGRGHPGDLAGAHDAKRRKKAGLNTKFDTMVETMKAVRPRSPTPKSSRSRSQSSVSSSVPEQGPLSLLADQYGHPIRRARLGPPTARASSVGLKFARVVLWVSGPRRTVGLFNPSGSPAYALLAC